jgi:hypothetical protein
MACYNGTPAVLGLCLRWEQRWCTLQHIARLHLHVIGKERLLSVSCNRGTAAVINSSKHDIHTKKFLLRYLPL